MNIIAVAILTAGMAIYQGMRAMAGERDDVGASIIMLAGTIIVLGSLMFGK